SARGAVRAGDRARPAYLRRHDLRSVSDQHVPHIGDLLPGRCEPRADKRRLAGGRRGGRGARVFIAHARDRRARLGHSRRRARRGGVWRFAAGLSRGTVAPWQVINVVSSTLTTCVLAWYIAKRAAAWARRSIRPDDLVVVLFLAVLPANAMLCIVYVKDVIM